MPSLAQLFRNIVWSKSAFELWQKLGFHVTKNHFYSPIPDTRELADRSDLWKTKSDLPGIDMNLESQKQLLERDFSEYKSELNFPVDRTATPHKFFLNNPAYGIIDASVLHLMIRHFKPARIIEIGSGYSTFVAARAARMNQQENADTQLTSIEPYPRKILVDGFPGLARQIKSKVENVDMTCFTQLGENDILFIDSSHVVRTGNDVLYLYLEVLPRLRPGVIVHIHDIFFPYHYPREWVIDRRVFWTEQYLLQAFLCLNPSFRVLFANKLMQHELPDLIAGFFAPPPGYNPRHQNSSFWMKRINGPPL